ncbi:MAG: glucosamine-6-phosphate deaminase, partial [Clostridia bacterium]|nr:glucosamine-6-phosphate deaminase [Clostridia bacterium]
MKNYSVDKLNVKIFDTRAKMGEAAALDIKNRFCELLSEKDEINVIFAAAPSQNDVLKSLAE